jgi:hypothetical protein
MKLTNFSTAYYKVINESDEDNNLWMFMLNISERDTDLTFVEDKPVIQGEVRIGLPMTIAATATNKGKNTTQDIPIGFYVNNNKIEQKTIKGLRQGEKKSLSFQYTPQNFGSFRIYLKIDPENKIKEYSITNNNITIPVTVDSTNLEWYNSSWHYRKIYDITDGGYVSIPVNFTKMLTELSIYNKTFESNTIKVIDYTTSNNISEVKDLNFNQSIEFDAETNATGNIIWGIEENKQGFYAIYFDVIENEDNRNESDYNDGLNYSTSNNWEEKAVDGWWMQLNQPIKNYYYPSTEELHINISSTAHAKNIKAQYYYNENFESSANLETSTNTT